MQYLYVLSRMLRNWMNKQVNKPTECWWGNSMSYIVTGIQTSMLCCAWSLRHVWLFATPRTVAHQALCSWGFSWQEYWNGLPCPPPGDLPHLGIEPRFSVLQPDSLPSEPPRKPKNTRAGSLSLLQGNFLTLGSNQGLLHCRQILYQLSYQETYKLV